jgi:TPR repeat protein
LGWAYAEGLGVERDYKEAARLYEIDANQEGGDDSAYRLALLYLSGRGVIKDVEEALKWFKRASEGGNIDAKKSIANLYDTGGEVGYDATMASKLYLEVALTGDVWSQRLLGFRYRNGNGLSVDSVESYAWFNVCASSDDSVAAMERDEAAKTLTRAQILAAQKRSREILKEIEAKKAKK